MLYGFGNVFLCKGKKFKYPGLIKFLARKTTFIVLAGHKEIFKCYYTL